MTYKPFKIDIHTHLLPPNIPDFKKRFGYGGFVQLADCTSCSANMVKDSGEFFRKVESNLWDSQKRIQECDESDVSVQVLSTVPVMFHYWAKGQDAYETSQFLNDHMAQVINEHPKRFVGLGTLPMQDSKLAVKELERVMKSLNFAGVQIGSHINDWNLDHEELYPFYEACSDLGAAVFIHPWDMMGKERMPKFWLPWLVGMPAEASLAICSMIFGGIFDKFPKLRVAFAHGGGAFPGTLGRISHGHQVRPDLCATHTQKSPQEYLGKFYVDTLVHDPKYLEYLVDLYGPESMMLGSDYPFPLGEALPGEMIEKVSSLSQKVREQLLFKNALTWMNRSLEDFLH